MSISANPSGPGRGAAVRGSPFLFSLLAGVTLAVILLPAYVLVWDHPALEGVLIGATEDAAIRIGAHVADTLGIGDIPVDESRIGEENRRGLEQLRRGFQLYKIRVFDPAGRIVYSSSAEEEGSVNDKAYFRDKVALGEVYSKRVVKGGINREGTEQAFDVVETYVPLMGRGRFLGAVEVYSDITRWWQQLSGLLRHSAAALLGLATILFLALLVLLARAAKAGRQREEALARWHALSRRQQLILNALGEGVCGLDAAGRITFINPAALRLLGREGEDPVGDDLYRVVQHHRNGAPYPLASCPIAASYREGRTVKVEEELFHRADGEPLPVAYTATPILDGGEIMGSVVVFRDITEQRRHETAALQAMAAAESASRAKSAFLANMSHELRTPLNGILGYAQIMERNPPADPNHRRGLEVIRRNTEQLTALLDNLLDLTRIEAHRLQLRPAPCALPALIDAIEQRHAPQAARQGAPFRVIRGPEMPLSIRCDQARLEFVLDHLLGNALRYSGQEEVRLTLEYAEGWLHCEVKDSGPGIPPDAVERIFEPFERDDISDYQRLGLGLGLGLCRRLVGLMGGEMGVESRTGRGSCFRFRIPVVADPIPTAEAAKNVLA